MIKDNDDDDRFDLDAMDEESQGEQYFEEGYESDCYADKPEHEQYIEDFNDDPEYAAAEYKELKKEEKEVGESESLNEWRIYRDEKAESDNPDEFPSFDEWTEQQAKT